MAHVTTVDMSLRYLLLNQLRSIQQAGYEVVGVSSAGPEAAVLEAAGIRHIAVQMSRSPLTPFQDLVALWQLYCVFRRERFTIVHTHTPKPGLLGQLAARMAGVPVVVNTLHGFYFHDLMHPVWRRFYITMEKIAAQCSDIILSQNAEDIDTAIAQGICSADRIRQLGNGIDLRRFDRRTLCSADVDRKRADLGLPSGAPVVGFVGRLAARRKGFGDFLRAAQLVAGHLPSVHFLIVGDADHGKPDAVLPSSAKDYGIWERCRFVGHRPNSELPGFYALMHVLALPSIFEGIPRVVMEACAMGLPVVATDVKGNREAVQQGDNGLLVPFGHPEALAVAILDLLNDPEKACHMGEEGRRMAKARFDERLVFERVKAEYARLLTKKGLPLPQASPTVVAP